MHCFSCSYSGLIVTCLTLCAFANWHLLPTCKGLVKGTEKEETRWDAVYSEFMRWRTFDIDAVAAPHLRKDKSDALPHPMLHGNIDDTRRQAWWACLVSEKLRNYDVAMRKRQVEAPLQPRDVAELPVYEHVGFGNDMVDPTDVGSNHSSVQSNPSDHLMGPDGDDEAMGLDVHKSRSVATNNPVSVHCGEIPDGVSLDHFHTPPSQVHARNAE